MVGNRIKMPKQRDIPFALLGFLMHLSLLVKDEGHRKLTLRNGISAVGAWGGLQEPSQKEGFGQTS